MSHRTFAERLDELTEQLHTMSHDVETLVGRAFALGESCDEAAVQAIRDGDHAIDEAEMQIEESTIELLALHQPMATDLRVLVTVLKINNDLERIGDHAVNIAEAFGRLSRRHQRPPLPPELDEMARVSRGMLRDSLDAFVAGDAELAREVGRRDDRVDRLHESLVRVMLTHMQEYNISACLQVILIGRNLERIADLATNIGEDVFYMVQGRTIRHGSRDAGESEVVEERS
ncbi:MAG: phosphate signaling complex protein PhoU [Gemmatimonadota bacterium]|nr:MAG: phosphate signaling complex protein PhoU [Gemmatimonadota bacterium]